MEADEIGAREPCPCGSSRTYGRCCKKRDFKWVRSSRGQLAKRIPLVKELTEVLKESDKEFLETFGRKPRKSDPVFFQKYYVSEKDLRRQTLYAMKAAGIRPVLVYAYKKTGFIVSNPKLLSTEEQKEWDAAFDEFEDKVEAGADPEELVEDDGPPELLRESIRKNQIVAGYFIEKHYNHYRGRQGSNQHVEMVAAFATTNFVRSLKSIHILLENDVGFDAYHLLRAQYENYLTLKYVYHRPQDIEVFVAQLGTLLGTHVLASSKAGVPIQSQVIEVSSGKKITIPTRWAMASALGELDTRIYNDVYRLLSSYCHSEITNVHHFISDRGFDYLSPDFSFDVMMVCHLLSMLFFECLKSHSPCAKYLKDDLLINAERSLVAIRLTERFFAETSDRVLPDIYRMAMECVAASDVRLRRVYEAIGPKSADSVNA